MLPLKAVDALHPMFWLISLGLLGSFVAVGNWAAAVPAIGLILGKGVLDFLRHVWCVRV